MKKTKPKFRIGDVVDVKATLYFCYDKENNRVVMRSEHNPPFEATVTGARRKFLGKYKSGREVAVGNWDEPDIEYDPPYLEVKSSVIVYLVREGMLNKEVECYEEDLKIVTVFTLLDPTKTKWKKNQTVWTKEAKDDLRKIMYDQPRDKNGKWLKSGGDA